MLCHRLYLNEEENIEKISTKIIIRNRHPIPWHHVHRLSCQPFTDGFTENYFQTDRTAGRTSTNGNFFHAFSDWRFRHDIRKPHPHTGRLHKNQRSRRKSCRILRNYAMEPDQSPVLLYDGSKKRNQKAHVAVFDLPLEHEDLQQCADSVIRVYAEYFWSTKQYDRIAFHFTNGFDAQYTKWADGYRIRVNGNNVSWIKSAQPDTSYDSLKDYLRIVFLMPVPPPWIPKHSRSRYLICRWEMCF